MRSTTTRFILAALFAIAFARPAQAAYHFGFQGYGGYSSSSVPNGFDSPTLIQAGIGASLGFGFRRIMLGVVSDFRWISQVSAVTNGSGNRRGERFNLLSPSLFIFFNKAYLSIEFQKLGEYKLSNLTAEGAQVIYQDPIGARVTFAYTIGGRLYLGAYVESVLFRKQFVSELKELHPPLNVWQTGLLLSWSLEKSGGRRR